MMTDSTQVLVKNLVTPSGIRSVRSHMIMLGESVKA